MISLFAAIRLVSEVVPDAEFEAAAQPCIDEMLTTSPMNLLAGLFVISAVSAEFTHNALAEKLGIDQGSESRNTGAIVVRVHRRQKLCLNFIFVVEKTRRLAE